MNKKSLQIVVVLLALGFPSGPARGQTAGQSPPFEQVILISVDGLRGDAISALGPDEAPAFYEFINDGAATLNARTDVDYTVTMPNHTCMLTGLPALGENGHGYTINDNTGRTLHDVKGRYVPGIFDVLNENHLSSALFSTKAKFMVFVKSCGLKDFSVAAISDDNMVAKFLEKLNGSAPAFLFLHISAPDKTGHLDSWSLTPGSSYLEAVKQSDVLIGKILRAIRDNPKLASTTAVIITADHGGTGSAHGDPREPLNFTIPFLVWGGAVAQGADLYALNPSTRTDPGQEQIAYGAALQPIRNGDAANLVLDLLGLPPIRGSVINSRQDLKIRDRP